MKAKIDRYFTENYAELFELSKRNVEFYKRSYDPSDVISYAYEYCISKQGEIESEDLDKVVYRVVITSCYWNNSQLNREILLKQTPFEGMDDVECKPVEVDDCDTLDKIRLERWFNDKKSVLALYRERIKVDKPKQIVLDKMLEWKTTNSRRLGEHFGIHYLSVYAYIKEIQEEIRDFEDEINTYDNKNNFNR